MECRTEGDRQGHARCGDLAPRQATMERRRKYLPVPPGMRVLACGLVALVTVLGETAAGQPAVTDLLGTLKLSSYPPGTKPPEFSGSTVEGRRVSLAGRWHAALGSRWRGGRVDAALSWLGRLETRMHAAYPRTRTGLIPIAFLEAAFHGAALAETYIVLTLVVGSAPSWLDAWRIT